jgi:hypothetical protein
MDPKDTSDGHHTFRELYEHRYTLYIALCRMVAFQLDDTRVLRSRLHHDGTMFDDSFILMIDADRPGEQISYHLPLSRWDDADFANTVERAPEYDGHTPTDVLARVAALR